MYLDQVSTSPLAVNQTQFVILKDFLSPFWSTRIIEARDEKDLLGHLSNLQAKSSIEHLIAFCSRPFQMSQAMGFPVTPFGRLFYRVLAL